MDKETQDSLPEELDELELGSVDSNSNDSVDSNIVMVDTQLDSKPTSRVVADITVSEEETDNYDPCYTEDQIEAINKFYQLKGKYDEIVRRKKQKIINNDSLSKREKKRLWESEKIKCINCRKPVGTFFSVKNRRLLAQCGAVKYTSLPEGTKACKLNIDIELANITTMQ